MSSFFFAVGDRDVSPFVRVGSGEGWDPAAGEYLDPQFSQSPLREGGELIQDTLGLRQMQVPLALNPRPYAATNAIQDPSFEGAPTTGLWGAALWTSATIAVVGSPALDSQALRYSGTAADQAAGNPQVQGATYMAVTPGAGDQVYYQTNIFAPSPPGDLRLNIRHYSSGAASLILTTTGGTIPQGSLQAAARQGAWTAQQLQASAHASAAFLRPLVQSANTNIATYDLCDVVYDRAMFVKLPGGTVPAGPLEYFDGDSLDGYWEAERSNSYSMTRVGKDGLHQMIQDLNRELARDDATVKWRDAGADALTFLDLARGRFDPEFNFRLAENNWAKGKLDLWCQPLGHTATERIVATASAAQALTIVPIPSTLAGDAAALTVGRITVGSFMPQAGNIVAVAPLPHPSYAAFIPAASLSNPAAGATLKGASGAQGSQVLALVPSFGLATQGATYPQAFGFSISPASVYAGRHRVLALAKSNLYSGNRLRLFDMSNQPVGPTAAADFSPDGYAPVDLGVLSLPSNIDAATYTCYLQAGAPNTASETLPRRAAMLASHMFGLHINGLVLMPEDQLQLVNDTARESLVLDTFTGAGSQTMVGRLPPVAGVPWAVASNVGSSLWQREDNGGEAIAKGASVQDCANALPGLRVGDMRARMALFMATDSSNASSAQPAQFILDRGPAGGYVRWYLYAGQNSNRHLSLFTGADGAIASLGLASFAGPEYLLEAGCQGPQAWISLRPFNQPQGELLASLGASHASFQTLGELTAWIRATGVNANGTGICAIRDFAVEAVPSVGRPARSVYLLDAVNRRTHRQDASQVFIADIEGNTSGQPVSLSVPSIPAVGVLETALEGEPANDVTNVEVRSRERFRFARS